MYITYIKTLLIDLIIIYHYLYIVFYVFMFMNSTKHIIITVLEVLAMLNDFFTVSVKMCHFYFLVRFRIVF